MGMESGPGIDHGDWHPEGSMRTNNSERPDQVSKDMVRGSVKGAILDLATEENLSDEGAIAGIVMMLEAAHADPNKNLAAIVTDLDPRQHSSETKLLDDKAKNRLNQALERFAGSMGN
jgi:hypothetical protein